MLTVLSECHFWTMREDVRIKSTDFGAFRYLRNRELQQPSQQEPAAEAKRDYTERRNGLTVLKNSRKSAGRLKDNIKRLEELLRSHKVVHTQWTDSAQVSLLFANGIVTHICVDIYTGDILRMVYEKYLVGRLAADTITDAFFTRSHIVLAYNTNQLTVVYLQKPNSRPQGPEKISNMDPRIFHAIIPGPAERRLARHLSVNSSYDLFVIWTKSSQNEVFPWRPTIRDQDRANIHVFKLKGTQLESFAYCWSENDPLCVDFLRSTESQILTLEQKVSRKGEITAELCSYDIGSGKMQRASSTSIAIGTQISCFAFSPDQEKLFLGCMDRSICLYDLVLQTTKFVAQIDTIPTQCSWHCDSSLIMIANTRSQFQCFDLALAPVGNQLQSEDVTPSNLLDISHYFVTQPPTLLYTSFSRKPDLAQFSQSYAQTDCFLLLLYDQGPIGCLRFFAASGMRCDIHNSGLTADVIVDKYLGLNQLEKAVNLLVALNWETYGAMCLISLHKIANYVFYRSDVKRSRLELMTKALKTFTDDLTEETKDEFSDQVYDLKRRFFFFLLRRNLFSEAFEVAQDIEDYDLFMDLFNVTKTDPNLYEFSAAAFNQAAAILYEEDRANGNSSSIADYRSESACSQSTSSDIIARSKLQQDQQQQNFLKNYVPPLPSLQSKVFNAEMMKINITKPELRLDETPKDRSRPPPPPIPDIKPINNTSSVPLTTAVTGNLAHLSLKSGTSQRKSKDLNNDNTGVPPPTQWQELTEPSDLFTPSTSHNVLPRVSTNNGQSQSQHTPYLHYTTAIGTADHTYLVAQRNYQQQQQQLPLMTAPAPASGYQPKFFQHPLVSGTIPSTTSSSSLAAHSASNEDYQRSLLNKKPTASILSNSSATQNGINNSASLLGNISGHNGNVKEGGGSGSGRNNTGEKNKVKFSDTVQVAVVPEIPRKEKNLMKRNGYVRPPPRNFTNPKKELADSLPLCHPNDEYLKDFNPLTSDSLRTPNKTKDTKEEQSSNKSTPGPPPAIKVVHFGVV